MGRVWRPVRFFAEEDGVQKPTLLFLIFAVLIGIGAWAGGILIWRDVKSQRYADSILTRTPTATATITPTATVTAVPSITPTFTPIPTATPYVYDDPATWEFVEKTDQNGEVYLDLQDWQKEQVWHFFMEFWNLYFMSESGRIEFSVIEPYISDEFLEETIQAYEYGKSVGFYFSMKQEMTDHYVYCFLIQPGQGPTQVKVGVINENGFHVARRDISTGVFIDNKWLRYQMLEYILEYRSGWKIISRYSENLN